jgi:hypothetical protein
MSKKIERSLGQIEGKVDSLIVDHQNARKESRRRSKDLHKRIDTVEEDVKKLEKIQYAIITIAGLAFSVGMAIIRKLF